MCEETPTETKNTGTCVAQSFDIKYMPQIIRNQITTSTNNNGIGVLSYVVRTKKKIEFTDSDNTDNENDEDEDDEDDKYDNKQVSTLEKNGVAVYSNTSDADKINGYINYINSISDSGDCSDDELKECGTKKNYSDYDIDDYFDSNFGKYWH